MDSGLASSRYRSSSTRGFPPIAFHRTVSRVLLDYLSARETRAILAAVEGEGPTPIRVERLTPTHVPGIVLVAERALDRSQMDPARRSACLRRLRRLGEPSAPAATRGANEMLLVRVEHEDDIVRARLAAGDTCRLLGFSEMRCTRVMTAVSELARNVFHYAGDGQIVFTRFDGDRSGVEVTARDQGPGIENLAAVLGEGYRSPRGTGGGLKAIRLLMDSFRIESSPGAGTVVVMRKARG